jgi:diacylglycerol O-acyltransferase / wax synthase
MKRLRGSDAYAIYSETPTSPFVTLKVALYRPTRDNDSPGSSELRGFIKCSIAVTGSARAALRILRVPFDLHHPVWIKDSGFSADDHIHEVTLSSPGSKTQLSDFLSELMGKPLDYERPLWEIWIVKGLEGGRIAVAFKIHHALADGQTLAKLIAQGHDSTSDTGVQAAEELVEEAIPGNTQLIGSALLDLAKSYTRELPLFYRHLKQARNNAAAVSFDESKDNVVEPFSAPYTVLNTPGGGAERCYRYQTFSLADFKALSRTFDCTINTLILGVCAETLKRYLEEVDELPADPLITAMPIGDRAGSSPRRMLDSDIQNNNLAVAVLPIYQNVDDFRTRLELIRKAAKAAIAHTLHDEGRRFDNYLDFLPGTAVRIINASLIRRLKKYRHPYANIVVSNVRGPSDRLFALDGRLEMEELHSVGNLMDSGHLNITVWSYVDTLSFSFFIRKDALPQADRIVDHLKAVVAELQQGKF